MPVARRSLAALLTVCLALWLAPGCAPTAQLGYLTPAELDLPALLASPPEPGSVAQRQDLAAVLAAQAARTPGQTEYARADAEVSVFRFADVLGPAFRARDLPLTAALFRQVGREGSAIGRRGKDHWRRPRPFAASPDVEPLLSVGPGGSYPSGHALFGYATGLLLAQIVPEKRDALLERGVAYGENRVVAGVHYPTDTAAGRIAATAMVALLMQDAAFREDFREVRAEVRRALRLP